MYLLSVTCGLQNEMKIHRMRGGEESERVEGRGGEGSGGEGRGGEGRGGRTHSVHVLVQSVEEEGEELLRVVLLIAAERWGKPTNCILARKKHKSHSLSLDSGSLPCNNFIE